MPDPILPDFFRAQVVLHGKSGKPEDVFVNSFVFRNDTVGSSGQEVTDRIVTALTHFYTTPATTHPAISGFFSSHQIAADATVKVYDLGKPTPRLPFVETMPLGAMSSGVPLPPEVACCLSFFAGRPLPRRRGRVFLGPLSQTAMTETDGRVHVAPAFRETVAAAAENMATDQGFETVAWHMLSQADGNAFKVTGGWVDDAPDTQRRRGAAAQLRTNWGAPPTSG